MSAMKFGMGQGVKRVEDVRLVSGRGSYTSDAAARTRCTRFSCAARTRMRDFRIEDVDAARAMPGVKGVYVAADFAELGGLACLAPMRNADKSLTPLKPYPVMAADEAAHVGDIVAMVVAESPLQARDAAEAIAVAWDELPLVVDVEQAIRPGAPQVFAGAPGNLAYDTYIGDKANERRGLRLAPPMSSASKLSIRASSPISWSRAARVAEYDAESGRADLARRQSGRSRAARSPRRTGF